MEDARTTKATERLMRHWAVRLTPQRQRPEAIRWELLAALAKLKKESQA